MARKLFDKRIEVRLTERELEELHDRAKKTKLSISRHLVKSGLSDGVILTAEDKEDIRQLRFELRKVGTNLNQVAYAFNASIRGEADAPTIAEINKSKKDIDEALATLLEFLKSL
jgi:hypothetical protein